MMNQYRIEWSKDGSVVDAGTYPADYMDSMIAYLRSEGFDYTITRCN